IRGSGRCPGKGAWLAFAPAAAILLAIVALIGPGTPRWVSWDVMLPENCCTTYAPSTAVPKVMPIWRLVLMTDEPRPARLGGVAKSTATVNGLSIKPRPIPTKARSHQIEA